MNVTAFPALPSLLYHMRLNLSRSLHSHPFRTRRVLALYPFPSYLESYQTCISNVFIDGIAVVVDAAL